MAVACSAATCKCMQISITSNPKISGNKVRDTSRSFNQGKRSTVLLPLDYTVPSVHSRPNPLDTAYSQKGIGQQEAMCFEANVPQLTTLLVGEPN